VRFIEPIELLPARDDDGEYRPPSPDPRYPLRRPAPEPCQNDEQTEHLVSTQGEVHIQTANDVSEAYERDVDPSPPPLRSPIAEWLQTTEAPASSASSLPFILRPIAEPQVTDPTPTPTSSWATPAVAIPTPKPSPKTIAKPHAPGVKPLIPNDLHPRPWSAEASSSTPHPPPTSSPPMGTPGPATNQAVLAELLLASLGRGRGGRTPDPVPPTRRVEVSSEEEDVSDDEKST
jgi:hypothetical protein